VNYQKSTSCENFHEVLRKKSQLKQVLGIFDLVFGVVPKLVYGKIHMPIVSCHSFPNENLNKFHFIQGVSWDKNTDSYSFA